MGSDPKKGVLTFEQFWQLVNLLEEASEASEAPSGADGDAGAAEGEGEEEEGEEPSPEELEAMAREMFDELKNPKTDKVTDRWPAWTSRLSGGVFSHTGATKRPPIAN